MWRGLDSKGVQRLVREAALNHWCSGDYDGFMDVVDDMYGPDAGQDFVNRYDRSITRAEKSLDSWLEEGL